VPKRAASAKKISTVSAEKNGPHRPSAKKVSKPMVDTAGWSAMRSSMTATTDLSRATGNSSYLSPALSAPSKPKKTKKGANMTKTNPLEDRLIAELTSAVT
jgi:hypothetical protein